MECGFFRTFACMRTVYHFRILRTFVLLLLCSPAFVAAGIWIIRLRPDKPAIWIAGMAAVLFFGVSTIWGLFIVLRLAHNSEALILTPKGITIRLLNGGIYNLEWRDIRLFREVYIKQNRFLAVETHQPLLPAAQENNRLRLRVMKLDRRITGAMINIPADSIKAKYDELYATLWRYLEQYGR